jgi:hypothetical protein
MLTGLGPNLVQPRGHFTGFIRKIQIQGPSKGALQAPSWLDNLWWQRPCLKWSLWQRKTNWSQAGCRMSVRTVTHIRVAPRSTGRETWWHRARTGQSVGRVLVQILQLYRASRQMGPGVWKQSLKWGRSSSQETEAPHNDCVETRQLRRNEFSKGRIWNVKR